MARTSVRFDPNQPQQPEQPLDPPQHNGQGPCDPPPDPRQLHEATDRLNEVLTRIEESLVSLNLGVSASVVLAEDRDSGWVQLLWFRKEKGVFKLLIEAGDPTFEHFNTTPITSASRETRLKAVEKLPQLHKDLVKAFNDELTLVNDGIALAEEFDRQLRAKAAK